MQRFKWIKIVKIIEGSWPQQSVSRTLYKAWNSPQQKLSDSVWITEITESVCELGERKEKVGRWVHGSETYTLALPQAMSWTTAPWLCHWRDYRFIACSLVWNPRNTFPLSPTVLALWAEICPNDRQTTRTRNSWETNEKNKSSQSMPPKEQI